jgi:peptidoglycan hydrolase-like protein with peptidoglycan-binding domain
LGKSSEHESLQTKTDKKPKKEAVEKPQDGPFATGEITLHPSNRLAAKIIQARLAELGFYRDRIDGIWKGHSKKALKEFKEARGLKYALTWDMSTQKALFQGTGR